MAIKINTIISFFIVSKEISSFFQWRTKNRIDILSLITKYCSNWLEWIIAPWIRPTKILQGRAGQAIYLQN